MAQLGDKGIQYVILSNEFDYTKTTFNDLLPYENIHYYKFPLARGGWLQRELFLIHGAQSTNRLFTLPGQSLWNSKAFVREDLDMNKPTCFIYSFRRIDRFIRSGFYSYVEKLFPKVYHVAWWDDIVRQNEMVSLDYAKQHFDLVLSYDELEAKKYGIRYYPSFYSRLPLAIDSDQAIEFDVCFVGFAKNRLSEIYAALDALESAGLNCHFVLNGVSRKNRLNRGSIVYNQKMSYNEVLCLSMRSRCILEIIQKGSTGQSLRVNEAFVLGRRLLTNNPAVKYLPQYDERYMRIFESVPSVADAAFIIDNEPVQYNYPLEKVSPVGLIEYIDNHLAVC